MINSLLIATAAYVVVTAVSAASDCTVAPALASITTWCSDCYKVTYSEVVCSTCADLHLSTDGKTCVDTNCAKIPSFYSSEYCKACNPQNPLLAADGKSCAPDCKVAPSSAASASWCNQCRYSNFNEPVCSVCFSMHANYDQTSCTINDCNVKPTTFTTSWCSSCQKDNQTAAPDGKSCVNVDCSVKPTNNYSDNWCNACSSPPTTALLDKSACSKSNSTSIILAKTSSTILQSIFALLLGIVAIL